ncbi:unnamed protein product [Clonostachys solani]|uniref:Chromo domain-containing protein n=1 Tax=Clonostachys solani TaxID=160281 RepID=A0A9P0EEW8_9HYPO|nr:unnamed protein product [Clonostachys solani]
MAATPPKLQRPRVQPNATPAGPSKGRLVIALNSKPRDYAPNSGPPAPRVTLLPPEDSTAYITGRLFLPPKGLAEKDGNPLPKRMIYVIAWRDLPAASMTVPVMDVLDYVSPAALEKWESENEARLDIEREEIDREWEELQKEQKAAEAHSGHAQPTKKRKRGRPRLQPASAADMETDDDAPAPLKGGALALSTTPKKSLLKEFEALDGDDVSPTRLAGRLVQGMEDSSDSQSGQEMMDLEEFYDAEEEMQTELPPVSPSDESLEEEPELVSDNLGFWDQPAVQFTPAVAERSSGLATKATLNDNPKEPNLAPWKPFGANRTFPHFSSNDVSSRSSPIPLPEAQQQVGLETLLGDNKETTPEKVEKKKKKKRVSSQPSAPPVKQDEEREWVVERIEDYNEYEAEGGGLVRYFKVRWEGNWPEDQNPSWEPEENLPPKLVRNWFKRGKRKIKPWKPKEKTPKRKLKQTTLSWAKAAQYSNVSEAFAGADEHDKAPGANDDDGRDEDILDNLDGMNNDAHTPTGEVSQDEEELFVVDDRPSVLGTPRFGWGDAGDRLSFFGT